MNKLLVGVAAGAVFGFADGLTAWFTPEVRPFLTGILAGSTFKGVLIGLATGFLAKKVQSYPAGIALGGALGLILAFLVASMPSATGKHYYLEMLIPGFISGALIGYCTQRWGVASFSAYFKGAMNAKANSL